MTNYREVTLVCVRGCEAGGGVGGRSGLGPLSIRSCIGHNCEGKGKEGGHIGEWSDLDTCMPIAIAPYCISKQP